MSTLVPYGAFQRGAVSFPLPLGSGGDTLLQDADPAIYFILDYFQFEVRNFIEDRLVQDAALAELGGMQGILHGVGETCSFDPEPFLSQDQFSFPLLGVWRKTTQWRQETASYEGSKTEISVLYAFQPMTAGQMERLAPTLHALAEMFSHQTTQGWDPLYTPPGGYEGEQPWALALAGIEEIGLTGCTYGRMPVKGADMVFPAVLIDGYIIERDNYVKTGGTYAGADITAGIVATDGTLVSPIAQVSNQQPPTIATLSTTTGPHAGGTAVTITGTLFLQGQLMVTFGAYAATSIVWVNSTTITCVTPAMQGAGVVGVSVVNHDGQSAYLASAFNFT
jgi:hypothetical protein